MGDAARNDFHVPDDNTRTGDRRNWTSSLARRGPIALAAGAGLIDRLMKKGLSVVPFDQTHAKITSTARELYGKGNGRGGLLNFGDLMVYAIAKQRGEPILCTGRDFASTDIEIHPASRTQP